MKKKYIVLITALTIFGVLTIFGMYWAGIHFILKCW